MNKRVLVFLVALAIFPGCSKRKKTAEPHKDVTVSGYAYDTKNGIYDEDIEAFVFEDESNPFGPAQDATMDIKLVVEDAENGRDTRAEQSQFGLKTMYFDFDHHTIRPDQREALAYNAAKIRDLVKKGHSIVIEGHACRFAGSDTYNIHLSEKRAHNVRKELIKSGVPAKNLKTVGRGAEMCIVPHGNRQQQAPNRRVDFYVE